MIGKYLNCFWNIKLSNNKYRRAFVFMDIGAEALQKFGLNLTNQLLRQAYEITHSHDNTQGVEYALRVNFQLSNQMQNIYYRHVAFGETNYVSIGTVEKLQVN